MTERKATPNLSDYEKTADSFSLKDIRHELSRLLEDKDPNIANATI